MEPWTLESGTVTLGKTLSSLGFSLPSGRRECNGWMRVLSALLSPLVDSGPRCCWTLCTPADGCVPCPCWDPRSYMTLPQQPLWPCPGHSHPCPILPALRASLLSLIGISSALKGCWTLPALCLECSSLDINITEFFSTLFFLFKYQLPR